MHISWTFAYYQPTGKTGNDKLSKGEPIKLDFDSAKRDPHILAQVRRFDNRVPPSLTFACRNGFNSFLNVSTRRNHDCGTVD